MLPQTNPNTPDLVTVLGIYPIRRRLLQYLDTRNFLNLYQTSWLIRQNFRTNEWNINAKLTRFFSNPTAFRSMLGRSNALISGSFALQFFERVVWPESNLDIMIQEGAGLEEMKGFLIDKERYRLDSETEWLNHGGDDYPLLSVTKCQTYLAEPTGAGSNRASERKVQLLIMSGPPVQAILVCCYTTALINFISWNKAYSIFPRATFLLHETVPLAPVYEVVGSHHAKWSKRGWRLRTKAVYTSGADIEQPLGYLGRNGDRRIGDSDTWVIRLDGATLVDKSASFAPDSVLEYSGFHVGDLDLQARDLYNMEDWVSVRSSLAVSITAELQHSHSLRYQYTSGNGQDEILFWSTLYRITNRHTLGQLCKMKDSEIEAIYGNLPPRELGDVIENTPFDHPEGWDYLDDLIPQLYQNIGIE
ncbi:hypothetical protein DL770_006919 [Monosporascus sp. CRB-9-2]|nr:hypothetical protein DL770_006919 [Monosporascus sp. CRB-9-2]